MYVLIIPDILQKEMIDHVSKTFPEEGCGLLFGKDQQVENVFPVTNQLHSPVRFYMNPVELVNAFEFMDSSGLSLLGIFHSHPTGPQTPSETDIKEFNYPGVASIILVPNGKFGWTFRVFEIKDDIYQEIVVKS